MSKIEFEIAECDRSGNIIATYVQSHWSETGAPGHARIDIIVSLHCRDAAIRETTNARCKQPEKKQERWQSLLEVFLPAGYPHSVTEDYLEYVQYLTTKSVMIVANGCAQPGIRST